jgi:hypothetical protein
MAKTGSNKKKLGIDRGKVAAYDSFWKELNYQRYPLEYKRVGWFRKASVIRKKRENEKIPDIKEYGEIKKYDVVVAGGGPSGTLYASMLAQKGYSVLLVEKNTEHECGSTWNLSSSEFEDLKSTKALTEEQFEELIVGRFKQGDFRLWNEKKGKQKVKQFFNVLNLSMDETKYFELLSKTPNLEIRLGSKAVLNCITEQYVFVELVKENNKRVKEDKREMVKAELFLDATGWTSILARTVNYERIDESWYNMIGIHSEKKLNFKTDKFELAKDGKPIGLICITYENEIMTKAGKVQPILERFSDFDNENLEHTGDVIYYFTRTSKPVRLLPMFDDMEETIRKILPEYDPSMVDKTYYGHAAGYYQQGIFTPRFRQLSAGDRTLMVGVAAQQYSGLTGCAFGCLARNARDICESIDKALKKGDLSFKTLQKIDIDPRERVSQSITDLYAGSMELDAYEEAGTVNRDWISFIDMGDEMSNATNADVLKDKIRITTLRKMLRMSADNPETIKSLFRNNRGHAGLVVATFIKGYFKLLVLEARYALKRRQLKYFVAGIFGSFLLPVQFHRGLRFLLRGRKVGK